MNSSTLQAPRELRSLGLFGRSLRTLAAAMLIALAFAPLRLCAQGLTGTYTGDDGGIYYVQQSGSVLWWAGLSLDRQLPADYVWHRGLYFTNIFRGNINSDGTIAGEWADVSRGHTLSNGTLTLAIASPSGVTQLTKTAATGGFGATTWTQTAPLDDTLFNGSTLDIVSRFQAIHKNNADLFCFLGFCGNNSSLLDNLKPYRDQTVLYGRLTNTHRCPNCTSGFESEIPHVNYGPPFLDAMGKAVPQYPDFSQLARDFKSFACYNKGDADFDIRLKTDQNRLEGDFYTTGWGNGSSGPTVFSLKFNDSTTHTLLNLASNEAYTGLESIMLGKAGTCDALQDPTYGFASLLPGWADLYSASVLLNGRPINGSLTGNNCGFIQPCPFLAPGVDSTNYLVGPAGIRIGNLLLSANGDGKIESDGTVNDGVGTYARVTGVLALDCGHWNDSIDDFGHTCDDNTSNPRQVSANQNQEIHPIYSIDVINSPYRPEDSLLAGRPNLTGAWGGFDGSTYYVRQIGNTIWWLGQMRDRQPIQRGTNFPIIGANELAPAFQAGDPPCTSSPVQCWAFANVFKGTITHGPLRDTVEGDWAGVPQSTAAGSSGGHMKFYVYNSKSIQPAASGSIFPPSIDKMYEPEDTTPPQSTLSIGSPQYPSGAAQPFVSSATPFTVTATDADSGVQNIWYRFLMQGSTAPAYTPIIGSSAVFTLTGSDGTYEVDTYATDNAGNDENSHAQSVVLDNTPPVATISQPAAAQYGHSDVLTLSYSVSDGTGSGVMSFTPKMDGQTAAQFGASLNSGQMIYLESMSLGTHTFSVDSVDNLANAGTNSVTFSIAVTFASLQQDVTNLVALGCIDNIGQSLTAKMSAAQNLYAKGQIQTAINILAAALYELQAQAGKHISTVCHDPNGRLFNPVQLLMADIQYLQASLAGQLKPDPILGSVLDSNNFGINGATVNLLNSAKTIVASTTTDATGFYFFPATAGLVLGSGYTVQVVIPKGYKLSTPAFQTFMWQGATTSLGNLVLN